MTIDRSTLLRWIAAEPAEEVASTEAIHDTVRRVRGLWSSSGEPSSSASPDTSPVPIGDVAAYVDGGLEPDVQRVITHRAAVDDGLLIEIISAARASRSADPVSTNLRSRLIAMRPQVAVPMTANAIDPSRSATGRDVQQLPQFSKRFSQRRRIRWAAAALAIATAAIFWLGRVWWLDRPLRDDDPIAPQMVENQPTPRDRPSFPEKPPIDQTPESGSAIVGASSPLPAFPAKDPDAPVQRMPEVVPPIDGPPVGGSPDNGLASQGPKRSNGIGPEMAPDSVPGPAVDMTVPGTGPGESVSPRGEMTMDSNGTRLASPEPWTVRWQRVHGILLSRSIDSGSLSVPPAVSVGADSVTRSIAVASDGGSQEVVGSGPAELTESSAEAQFGLQTLPLCRATGITQDGNTLVVAGDSRLDVGSDHSIDLVHGSIAWLGDKSDYVWSLARKDHAPIPLQLVDSAQLVVTGRRDHYEVAVIEGSVRLGAETLDPGVYLVSRLGNDMRTAQADGPNPPAWVRRPTDRIELPRTVLAQLASTSDLSTTLRREITATAAGTRTAQRDRMMLCGWLAAANDSRLYPLIGSPDAMIREAAMNRILLSPPADPRHGVIWKGIASSQVRARVQQQVLSLFRLYWNRRRPEPAQAAQLIRLLQMQDTQSRAIADYLLRAFYGDGPAFDPAMDNRTLARVVNAWEQIIRRSETRRAN